MDRRHTVRTRLPLKLTFLALGVVAGTGALALVAGDRPPLPPVSMGRVAGGVGHYQYLDFTWGPGVRRTAEATIPKEAMVYQAVGNTPTKADARAMAARMGLSVPPERYATLPDIQEDARLYMLSFFEGAGADEVNVVIELQGTGCYSIGWHGREPMMKEAVSEERTAEIARQFLARTGLLPEDLRFQGVSTAESMGYSVGQKSHTRVLSRRATWTRYWKDGRAGSLSVEVDGTGHVRRVRSRICNVTPLARYPILTPEEARQQLHSPQALVSGDSLGGIHGHAAALIEKVELWYEDASMPPRGGGAVIQPLYRFEGRVTDAQRHASSFTGMLPAVRPEYIAPAEPPRRLGGS